MSDEKSIIEAVMSAFSNIDTKIDTLTNKFDIISSLSNNTSTKVNYLEDKVEKMENTRVGCIEVIKKISDRVLILETEKNTNKSNWALIVSILSAIAVVISIVVKIGGNP